jgi:DNA-binding MarR family transcriptional regulator
MSPVSLCVDIAFSSPSSIFNWSNFGTSYYTECLDVKTLWMEDPLVTVSRPPARSDSVDTNLEIWARELPELDLETEGIVERIHRLERFVDRAMQETLDAFDLSHGEWKVLANLRRAGPPYRGKPGMLSRRLALSSGAMTNRLDNMEERGLVRRLDDPDDRRGVIVELTDEGKRLWDASVAAQAEKESIVDSALGDREKRQLNELLRRLMHAFEDAHGPVHPPHE